MPAADRCPACGAADLDTFYELDAVPAHSVLNMKSREQALAYPTGSLRIACCRSCGFITNRAFDAALNEYSPDCEESQGFSPYFQQWLRGLAQDYVDRYDLRDKDVLEIGCGKGEFLVLLCELGHNRGIGIDPAYVAERLTTTADVRFIAELYSERYGELAGDAVICRHTLEHIAPVSEFVGIVERSLHSHPHALVFFELPETLRVLRELAFWDVYYEHCSYFTPGSLARLMRRHHFDPVDLRLDYDDQYVLVDARPGTGSSPLLPLEDDLAETLSLVDRFRVEVPRRIAELRDLVTSVRADGGRVVIWGAGSKGVSFLTTLGLTDEIEYAVDVNPFKHGMYMARTGQEIVAPDHLRTHRPDLVIVMNSIYEDEIRSDLTAMDVTPKVVST